MSSPRPLILVVDDERDLAATCERLLRRRGYQVITAGSREEGLAAVAAHTPALVISDVFLPDGDGLDIVRAARRAAAPIPAIVMTAFASPASREAALAAGAGAYISKPFATTAFAGLVDRMLGVASDGDAAGAHQAAG
jgi:CheY-like chemotaxis protein